MKLRNKKTGKIVELDHFSMHYSYHYDYGENARGDQPCSTWNHSLAELNEEWEDYEEPKESFWTIGKEGTPIEYKFDFDGKFYEECDNKWVDKIKEIGFYFETKEEAELAVRKLKAWKRLKDKGFRFTGINDDEDSQELITQCGILCEADIYHLEKDADFLLISGGEE